MEVFISWSKSPSLQVATALHAWLPKILPQLVPWISNRNLGPGQWMASIGKKLETCAIGIACITRENHREPWLNFESGALARASGGVRLFPYLIGVTPADLVNEPLQLFQGWSATMPGTKSLIEDVNRSLSTPLPQAQLDTAFLQHWPQLDAALTAHVGPAARCCYSLRMGSHGHLEGFLDAIKSKFPVERILEIDLRSEKQYVVTLAGNVPMGAFVDEAKVAADAAGTSIVDQWQVHAVQER